MNKSIHLPWLAAGALAAWLTACGGEDLVLPSEGEPASITLIQGDGQSGRVGEELPQPLVLEVSDRTGRPVAGAAVVVEVDGAEPQPDTAQTETDGRATVGIVMGPEVGPATGQARVLTPDGQQPVQVDFTLNALASSANGLTIESGNEQSAPAGAALPAPLVVRVTDAFGNPISGVTITWTPVEGGSASETSTVSDASGLTSVLRTLGSVAGPQTTLAASVGLAGSPVLFTHTATPGSATGVTIVSGNEQSGEPGAALAQPLVVLVSDAAGNPIPSAAVTWVVTGGGGTIDPSTSTTDASGNASAGWTLGPAPGENTAEAVVSGVGQASFRATALAAGPAEIRIVSGNPQTGQVGQPLGSPLVVAVLDASGSPVPGATVNWLVRGGGGSVNPATSTTGANGQASATWTLGSAPGANRLEASVSGAGAVSFLATATPGAASVLAVITQPSGSATLGAPFDRQPVVQLRDAAGNDVAQAGVTLTAAIAAGPGSLGGNTTQTTGADGRATFTDLSISGTGGTHRLRFDASGFSSATSADIEVGRIGTETRITGHGPEPSAPGEPVTVTFTVSADAGTPTGTVTVTASGGPETCSADASVGSCVITLNGESDRELTASYAGTSQFAPSSDTESHDVDAPNSTPSAANDSYQTPAGTPLQVAGPGVLANDQDADGDNLEAELVTGVSNGTLTLDSGGGFSYTPTSGFTGTDSFTYRAQDPSSSSDPATVLITVQ